MSDVLVVGGGVIGLSIAYELGGQGVTVRLVDQSEFGCEASWAGAGILPPGNLSAAETPEAKLRALSHQQWPEWSGQLVETTGIDNGYRNCGGICVQIDGVPTVQSDEIAFWQAESVEVETLTQPALLALEPALNQEIASAYHLPQLSQVRNPRHLKALVAGCAARGVELHANTPVVGFDRTADRITGVRTPDANFQADKICVAAGAWSQRLLASIGMSLPVKPMRGQIVMLQTTPLPIRHVIEIGSRYLVPRPDGRILIGSTEEQVGFHKANTAEGIAGLLQLATTLVPKLADASVERCWSGLRPASADRLPYLDRPPETENLFIAAGHFRSGLQMSPGTATFMRALILDQETPFDRHAFSVTR